MADGYLDRERPRRRRGRRLLISLLVLLIVLGVALAVADRVGAAYAERRIADQVATELTERGIRSSRPDVSVRGYPFLTQVLAGRYEKIVVGLTDLQSDRADALPAGVQVQRLDVTANDVVAPLRNLRTGQGDIVARDVRGTAIVDYASVTKLINQPGVRLAERGGKLAVTAPLELLGQQLTVNGTAELTVAQGAVRIRFRELTAEGLAALPGAENLVNAYAQQISVDLPIGELPFGLVVQEVRPQPEGLSLIATGRDVPLNAAAG